MEALLKKYQSRIINISKRNRSLVLNKIYKKRSFDLVTLDSIFVHKAAEIFEILVLKKKNSIEILPYSQSFFKKYKRYIRKIEIALDKLDSFNIESVKEIVNEYLYDINYSLKEQYDSVNEVITDLTEQLTKMTETIEQYSYSLQTLFYEVDFERKETGIHNLKLALNFVEGKFNQKDSFCRAPLGYISVYLKRQNKRWFLITLDEGEVVVNDVFLFSARMNNDLETKDDLSFEVRSRNEVIKELIEFYKSNDIDITDFERVKLTTLSNYTVKDYAEYKEGELAYKGYFVVGQFPTANAIYHDYNRLIDISEIGHLNNKSLKILLGNEEVDFRSDEGKDSNREFLEHKFYYVNQLDYSQELALKKCCDNGSLVVFGPPGTGKSQTISNMVADSLAKGNRVLVVSQKKAALDVIYNRLSSIKDKMCLIHDSHNDRSEFYRKTTAILERFEARYPKDFHYKNKREHYHDNNEERLRESISDISTSIEDTVKSINTINEFLFTPKQAGFTGKEMYANAFSNLDLDNLRKELFDSFILIKEFLADELFCKDTIMSLHNELNADSFIETKYKLEELLKVNPLVNNLNKDLVARLVGNKINAFSSINENIKKYYSLGQSSPSYEAVFNIIKKIEKNSDLNEAISGKIKEYIANEYPVLLQPVATGLSKFFRSVFSSKKLRQEEENRTERYQYILNELQQAKESLLTIYSNISQQVKSVESLFEKEFQFNLTTKLINKQIEIEESNLSKAVYSLNNYNKYVFLLEKLSENAKIIVDSCYEKISDQRISVEIVENLKRLMISYVLESMQHTNFFTEINSHIEKYNNYLSEVNSKIIDKHLYSQYYINVLWNNRFLIAAHDYDYREFRRLAALKRRIRSLRTYFKQFQSLVFSLYPCVLMGPETVSEVLPFAPNLFDVIIFDEASQMFIEDAIPTIFRGIDVVIAGDDKQLKPTMTFRKKYDDENKAVQEDFTAASEEESLLDLAKHKFLQSQLQFHYRSHFSQLINFSNHAFYDGNLQISPNRNENHQQPPIERIMVKNGLWKDRQNVEEAKIVVEKIKEILKTRKQNETLGVITFNITQRNCILDLLSIEANKDDEFEELLLEEQTRKKGDEDVSIFVKNIENVQGDERDIIIFSTGYARDVNGKFRHQFGDLSKDSGENRLNVAITRAKYKVYVVTSFEPEQLKVEGSKNFGPKRFKQYLQYAKLVSLGDYKKAENYLTTTFSTTEFVDTLKFDSPFEEEVYNELVKLGYNVKTQVGVNGYRIDLGIYDEDIASYVLGIECDGVAFHGSINARQRDIHRQNFLESRGWKIHRIWSNHWWNDREAELKRVIEAINRANS